MSSDKERDYEAAAAGFVSLARPADWALSFAGAVLAARLAGSRDWHLVSRGAAAVATIIAGTYVHGAWLRKEVTVLARPRGPLARGVVRAREAKWLGIILVVGGIAVAATLGLRSLAAAALTAAVMLSYPYFFSKAFLARNLFATAAVVLPVLYGWFWVAGGFAAPVFPAAVAALMAAAASFFTDVEEVHADGIVGLRTPARYGPQTAITWGGGMAAAAAAVAAWAYGAEGRSYFYLAVVAAVTGLMLLYMLLNLRRREPDPSLAGSTARMIKFLIFVVLAGFYVDTLMKV